MSRKKHSYVPFYMDDWAGGTIRMPRLMRSVYFDICFYVWDKAAPVPEGELAIIIADLEGQGEPIVDLLIASGRLVRDERGVYQPRALAVSQEAYDLWKRKSDGGSKGRGKTDERELEELSKDDSSQNQNQNQPNKDKLEEEEDAREAIVPGWDMIPPAWNALAARHGLRPIVKMTDERTKRLKARIAEHGVNGMLEAIATIPDSPFLMGGGERGWKAHFDWLLQPSSCVSLIEGQYHKNGDHDGNGISGNAYVTAAIERKAERAAGQR